MEITLSYNTLYQQVERSLSIIGKRSRDDNGSLLFTDITLGSREKEIINDYFRQAIIDLSVELSAFIVGENDANGTMTISLELPTNHNEHLETFIQKTCEAYCVSYALQSWFTVTAPRLAEKSAADCVRMTGAIIRLVNNKQAPDVSDGMDIMAPASAVEQS